MLLRFSDYVVLKVTNIRLDLLLCTEICGEVNAQLENLSLKTQ